MILEAKHMMYVDPISPPGTTVGLLPGHNPLTPVAIGVTAHHFLVLRQGQLQMLSNLSGDLVQEEALKISVDGQALALVRDPTRSAPWLITTTSIFQVSGDATHHYLTILSLQIADLSLISYL